MSLLRLGLLLRASSPDAAPSAAVQDLQGQIGAAHREWQAAQQYFDMVHEVELIDHAIYTLEAAHRKYRYLMRRLRDGQEA